MADENEKLDECVRRGFDAGNYDSAYVSEDYATAWKKRERSRIAASLRDPHRAAYTLGFFGTYELHEMGGYREDFVEAYYSDGGKRCVALGLTEARDESEMQEC